MLASSRIWLGARAPAVAMVLLISVSGFVPVVAQGAGSSATPPAKSPSPPAPAQGPSSPEPAPTPTPSPSAAPTPPVTTAPPSPPAAPQQTPAQAPPSTTLPEVDVIQARPQPPAKVKKELQAKRRAPAAPSAAAPSEAKGPVKEAPAVQPSALPAAPPIPSPSAPQFAVAPPSDDVKMSPLGGAVPIGKVPSSVSTVSSSEIARTRSDYAASVLANYVPGIIVSDYQGNGFQTNVDYRGFNSSPVDGVPQGLAVYQNGVRINESFGDTVNYDFITPIAIANMTVMSGNPVFGLNAIGGSISIDMKNGFNYHGFEADTRFGSFGRVQGSIQDGRQFGNWATYIAMDAIRDEGFREKGTSDIRRLYADLGVKGDGSEFHLNFTGADNSVGVAAASPVELLDEGWGRVFTTPQSTTNEMEMVSLNGSVQATDTLQISGVSYYRHFKQKHIDGNISDAEPCAVNPPGPPVTGACLDNLDGTSILLRDTGGNLITVPGDEGLGEIDRTFVDTNSFGAALQGVDKSKLFDRNNQFLLGGSIDHGEVAFSSSAQLGTLQPNFVVAGGGPFVGPFGDICTQEDDGSCTPTGATDLSDIRPVDISTTNTYYGLYFLDTFDATDRLTLTAGGRFNVANIQIHDETGLAPNLNSDDTYFHFNPVAGGTYKLLDGVSLYGSFSEANRAPVAAELACADPDNPCLLPSFLTSDPPLKQVVSYTWEVGLKGSSADALARQKMTWSLGYFHTLNTDDIINVASPIIGRSSFTNAGDTLREGVEAQINYWQGPLFAYAGYNFVEATFQSNLTLQSPFNPFADEDGNIFVHPGDRLPGVPMHKFKAGVDYSVTPRWRMGADLIAASNQIFFGDESNQNAPLGGYAKVNLHTSYDVTDNIQIYGLVDNAFNAHYGVYGTFFDVDDANEAAGTNFTDPRTIVPAAPIAAYGGLKVTF